MSLTWSLFRLEPFFGVVIDLFFSFFLTAGSDWSSLECMHHTCKIKRMHASCFFFLEYCMHHVAIDGNSMGLSSFRLINGPYCFRGINGPLLLVIPKEISFLIVWVVPLLADEKPLSCEILYLVSSTLGLWPNSHVLRKDTEIQFLKNNIPQRKNRTNPK